MKLHLWLAISPMDGDLERSVKHFIFVSSEKATTKVNPKAGRKLFFF